MKSQIKHTFNITFMIIIMSIFVIVSVSKSYIDYNHNLSKELNSQADASLSYSTQLSAQAVNTKISTLTSSLKTIALSLSCLDLDKERTSFNRILSAEQKRSNISTLTYYPSQDINSAGKRPYIEQVLQGEQAIYMDSAKTNIYILTPVFHSTTISGCLQAVYSLSSMSDLFSQNSFNGKGTALVMLKDSTLFSTSETNGMDNYIEYLKTATSCDYASLKQLHTGLEKEHTGIITYTLLGQEWHVQYTPIGILGLSLCNQVPTSVLEKPSVPFTILADKIFQQIIVIMAIFIIFILFIQLYNNRNNKTNQQKLLLEKERYQVVLAHSQGAVWEYDIASDTMTKSDPDLGIHTTLSVIPEYRRFLYEEDVIHPDYFTTFENFYKALNSGQKEIQTELIAKDISGKMVWFELSGTTVFDNNGLPVSVIGQTVNIDARKRELEELRNHANRDSLTKLYNRNALMKKVNECIQECDVPMTHALFMIDIDNFKGINDTYGHTFGDAVLIELSTKLLKYFEEPNILCRLGGDEFVVFLYNVPSLLYVKEKAERIISIFKKMYGGVGNHTISGSVGIAIYPEHGTTFQDLLTKSDIALYHSKGQGKDCYSIYRNDMTDIIRVPDLEENHKESRYQLEDRSLIDSSIIANTVNLLFDAREINTSINMILSVIGNYYNLDSLNIVEFSDDRSTASITFEWSTESNRRIANQVQDVRMEIASKYMFYTKESNGVFVTNDISSFMDFDTNFTSFSKTFSVTSTFQCALMENNIDKGFINAFLNNPNRSFSKPEISSLTLLSKIIGGYLLKLRAQEKVDWIAKRDPLTGCYNLFQFTTEADKIVESNPDESFILIYTDLDKFKLINDTYGYSEGDRVLIEYAKRMQAMAGENEIIGRVSGDRFVGLFKYDNKDAFLRRLTKFNKSLNAIPKTQTDFYKLALIAGLYPITRSDNITVNIDRANIARKSITERHKSTFVFFNETMKSRLVKQREIEDIMEEALQNQEFIIYYQPKFNLISNTICGAEALIRWNRPEVGLMPPNEFIPIFEENGFIVDIDYYVLDKVCSHIRSLLDRELHVVPVSVNFSRFHLKNQNLVSHLKNTVFRYDIPASLIEIEVTESALVDDDNSYLLSLLHDIHNAGFRLSMDDFGSGLSSLNMLRTMPFDVLKLDKNFFHGSTTTEREIVVITNVVKMANELHMEIVSEGVETEEQADLLRAIHCSVAQGFLFERPIPIALFEEKYCSNPL